MSIDIESIKRAVITTPGTTVGDLRAALEDARIPDAAEVMDVTFGCEHVERQDYCFADFAAGTPLVDHTTHMTVLLEWED